jgi:PilZ domain
MPARKFDPRLESKMSDRSDTPIVFPASLREEPPKSEAPEQRAQVRYPFTAAAEIYELRSQTRVSGRCSDLGAGGCYIDTLSPFAVGAVVRIRMKRDAREFEAAAVVAYAHVSMGMGLSFTEIKREHQDVLRSWIADLSGEQPPEPAPSATEPETGAVEANANVQLVLHELITLLVRKKIITENEAVGFLRQMFR